MDERRCDLFGLGVPHHEEGNVRYAYPFAESEDIFGLGDEGCTCPPINVKNASMVGLGSLVAWKGLGFKGQSDVLIKLAAGAIGLIGLWDIIQGFQKKAAVPQEIPSGTIVPHPAIPGPIPGSFLLGAADEWYPDEPMYGYSRRFLKQLTSRYYGASQVPSPSYMR
jgi:hypothetical protein